MRTTDADFIVMSVLECWSIWTRI